MPWECPSETMTPRDPDYAFPLIDHYEFYIQRGARTNRENRKFVISRPYLNAETTRQLNSFKLRYPEFQVHSEERDWTTHNCKALLVIIARSGVDLSIALEFARNHCRDE